MLLKALLQTPVLGVQEGKLGGTVCGWLIDGKLKNIAAFLFTTGAWYDGIGAILPEQIQGIGDGAMVVHSLEKLNRIEQNGSLRTLAAEHFDGLDAPVFTPVGKSLGRVENMEIDDRGSLNALILQDGTRVAISRVLLFSSVILVKEEEISSESVLYGNFNQHDGEILVPSSGGNPIIIRTNGTNER